MGIYDREYIREEKHGFNLGGDRSMVANLILLNIAVYIMQVLSPAMSGWLELRANLLSEPWQAWRLLTAGFAHDPTSVWHIGMNMFALWLFGRDVETVYGRYEFLRIYLALIVLSSLGWVVVQIIEGDTKTPMMGASGAVSGILVLSVFHFPRRLFYIWGIFPVPAWLLASLYLLQDLFGLAAGRGQDGPHVAYAAHLSGALFGFIYYQSKINLGRFVPSGLRLPSLRTRPKLRVHEPAADGNETLEERVDRLLDKVSRQGIDSLSDEERRLLEDASRRYQRRRS